MVVAVSLFACGDDAPAHAPATSPGAEASPLAAEPVPPEAEAVVADPPSTTEAPTTPALSPTGPRRPLLSGRLSFEAPASLRLRPRDVFLRSDEREHYDAYDVRFEDCALTIALMSAGLLRPAGELAIPEGGERRWVPDEASSSRLEIVTSPHRHLETLAVGYDGPGAVVFERDGTATDLFVWARASESEEDADVDRWHTDPSAVACLEPARQLRDLVLATLAVERPYASTDVIHFGYEEARDDWVAYRGVLPAGWTISSGVAFDAGFEYVHRRLPWSERPPYEPTPAAKIWAFTDSWVELSLVPAPSPRHATLFGRELTFDVQGCAQEFVPDAGMVQYLCLQGTAVEQDELVAVLATFVPVDGRAHRAPAPPERCVGTVSDETPLNVRVRPLPGAPIVGELPDRAEVDLVARSGGWARIAGPVPGWIHGMHVMVGTCAAGLPDLSSPAAPPGD